MKVIRSKEGDFYVLTFDMNPRLVDRAIEPGPVDEAKDGLWAFNRYTDNAPKGHNDDARRSYRKTPAAFVMWGPLLLAKAQRIGATKAEIQDTSTVNGQGYKAFLKPLEATDTWGLWELELKKDGAPTVKAKVCDFQSAGDDPSASNADAFSIWF